MAQKALQVALATKALLNVEYKRLYINGSGYAFANTVGFVNLSPIAQGDDYNTRNGNSIMPKSWYFRAFLTANVNATVSAARLMFFWYNHCDGANPPAADLLQTPTGLNNIESPLTYDIGKKMKVIYDKVHVFTDASKQGMQIKIFKKIYKRHIKYDGTDATIGSCSNGQLFMATITNESVNVPTMDYYSTLRFIDN